jgi:uncharacterized protein with predicted RNA binding PUA domain
MADELAQLRTVADYQFGAGAGTALFPPDEDPTVTRSTGGRPRQVRVPAGRLVTYGTDGRFTLGIEGGRRLVDALPPHRARVDVGDESVPFVREGRNVFAKFVRAVDDAVRPGDEVAVVYTPDAGDDPAVSDALPGAAPHVVAVGRAELGADAMHDFDTGMAVKVRQGLN